MAKINRSITPQKSGNPAKIRPRPATSVDVARLAKVSRATVSYVLNDVEDAGISDATKERVRQAALELGYIPHKIASSLRSGRSDLVILPFFNWPYNQSSIGFLQEMASGLDQLGYSVMLHFLGKSDREAIARKVASFHPIGVVFGSRELTRADVELLTCNGVKAILSYEDSAVPYIPSIALDNTVVGESVAQHFIQNGHRHIAAIVPRDKRIMHLGLQRLEGLKRGEKTADIHIEKVDLAYDVHEAGTLAAKWKEGPRPSAIFTYNDDYGLLLMGALQDVGLRIPDDIALVGCDDLPLCEMVRPRLSSVNIGSSGNAEYIVNRFHQMIQGKEQQQIFKRSSTYRLMIRETG
jgi:DNA-binding LacI/PurR family transcriptional regulator